MNIVDTLNAIRDSEEIRKALNELNEIGERLETICFIEALIERTAKVMCKKYQIISEDKVVICEQRSLGALLRWCIENCNVDGMAITLKYNDEMIFIKEC